MTCPNLTKENYRQEVGSVCWGMGLAADAIW